VLLKQFKKREGRCNIPQSHEEDETKLGVRNQTPMRQGSKAEQREGDVP
jgi:hypothetical protein